MTHPTRSTRHPARLGIASLTAAAALLAVGTVPSASAAPPTAAAASDASGSSGAFVGLSTLSSGWSNPWAIAFLPDAGSALVTERDNAKVYRLYPSGYRKQVGTVPNTVPEPYEFGPGGLLGVAVPPTWHPTRDQDVFFMHTTASEARVVRMKFDGRSLWDPTVVLSGLRRGSNHNGGTIAFGPDGYLYVATGDATQSALAQDINSLNGKILRITRNGTPAPGNPFGNQNHVYSYGHRNPYGLAWDSKGRLWTADIGQEKVDELNLDKRGHNYGWPVCEGYCDRPGMTNPKATWHHRNGTAQIAFVGNDIYLTSLTGHTLWRVPTYPGNERVGEKSAVFGSGSQLRAIAKVPGRNELWVGTNEGAGRAKILRVTVK